MNQIVLSPVRQYKISNNNLQQRQSTRFEAEDSNAIDTVRLQEKLNCSKQWVEQFYNTHSELLSETSDVLKNVELLLANGVKTGVVLDNPKMLTLSNSNECLRRTAELIYIEDCTHFQVNLEPI